MPEPGRYIVVVGGGRVGFYLTRHLLEAGHEVTLIEKDPQRAALVSSLLGSCSCLVGDADELSFLATTGIERASLLAAVTGDDEDNLVACQMARREFGVARTIARVNNPANVQLFHRLGVDVAVSATELILSVIETGMASQSDVQALPLSGGESSLVRLSVPPAAAGRRASELADLANDRLLLVVRAGTALPEDAPLQAGDDLVLFTSRPPNDFALGADRRAGTV